MEYGGGSVYQRKADGRWMAAVCLIRPPGAPKGPRLRKVFSGPSAEVARRKLEAWLAENPRHTYSVADRRTHLAEARAKGTHAPKEWWRHFRNVEGACFYCGVKSRKAEKDHKVPVSRGGSDALDNLCVTCPDCNAEKGTRTADEYFAWKKGAR